MPIMNGFEVLEELARKTYDVPPIYIVTSSNLSEDKRICRNYNFVKDFFQKPISRENLLSIKKED